MPFQRPLSVLASALAAAGIVLTVASCAGHITPLGPQSASTPRPVLQRTPVSSPQVLIRQQAPFVLEAMRTQPSTAAGGCPAGYVALSGDNPTQCYRKIGTPVTITSAGVSPVTLLPAAPSQHTGPAQYGFMIVLPDADVSALTDVTTTAYRAHGSLAISAGGRTWALPFVGRPFTSPQLQIPLPRKQALKLQRMLVPSG
jgi:hypothetical protein